MVAAFDRSSLDHATVGNVLLDGTIRGLARFDGSSERFCQRLGQCIDHVEPEWTIYLCLEAAQVIRDAINLSDHHTVLRVLIPLQGEFMALNLFEIVAGKVEENHGLGS